MLDNFTSSSSFFYPGRTVYYTSGSHLEIHSVVCLCSSCLVLNVCPYKHCTLAELNEAHLCLSCTTELTTLQALSVCLFLSNSHSLFTFAFLHCDSRQSNIAPDPRETDCQASLFKVVLNHNHIHNPVSNVRVIFRDLETF